MINALSIRPQVRHSVIVWIMAAIIIKRPFRSTVIPVYWRVNGYQREQLFNTWRKLVRRLPILFISVPAGRKIWDWLIHSQQWRRQRLTSISKGFWSSQFFLLEDLFCQFCQLLCLVVPRNVNWTGECVAGVPAILPWQRISKDQLQEIWNF